jgi:hypothetical protein
MVGMALAKSVYVIPTWTRTAVAGTGKCPSVYACYRFTAKLRAYKALLDACIDAVTARLHDAQPEMGQDVAIDGSDLPALGLIDAARKRGFNPRTAIMDKGYDNGPIHNGCMDRNICPVTPLRKTPAVVRGDHKPPLVRARRVDVRRDGLQAQGDQMALPHGRVQARLALGEGRPAAPAHPAPHGAVAQALQQPWRYRAGVRQAQARMGAVAAARPWPCRVRLHADLTILTKGASIN